MSDAITVSGLHAGYGAHPVLMDLAFSIEAGSMVGLLGPNGAGKTTLFRVLTGLLPFRRGSVSLFDRPLAALSARTRARLVAVIPQELATPVAFSVEQLVMIGRTAGLSRWGNPASSDKKVVERAMAYTDLMSLRARPLDALSGGEKQRALVAMALAQEPRIILMDEATSHLDINHRLEIMQIVEQLNRTERVTVLMISHDLNLAAEFCERLILLDHGETVGDGPPPAVLTQDALRRVYHCDVRVHHDPTAGSLTVVPARSPQPAPTGKRRSVHVVAGGGCGSELIRHLLMAGHAVSCGVLNEGDADALLAAALGVETVLEKPFSPITPAAVERAGQLAARADAVVLTDVPFGSGNEPNLEIAEHALLAGRRVLVMDAALADRDYTAHKSATRRVALLVEQGARSCPTLREVLEQLD